MGLLESIEKHIHEVEEHNQAVLQRNAEIDAKIERLERAKSKLISLSDTIAGHSFSEVKKAGEKKWLGNVDKKHERSVDKIEKSQDKIVNCINQICQDYDTKINSLNNQKESLWIC